MAIREQRIFPRWGSIYHADTMEEAIAAGSTFWKTQMYTRRLVILRNPDSTEDQFWSWCNNFGKPFSLDQYVRMMEYIKPIAVGGRQEFIGLFSNLKSSRLRDHPLYWHADNADVGLPMRAIRMSRCPNLNSGSTSWLNTEEAWQHLPEEIRAKWRTRQVEQQSWYSKGTSFTLYPAVKDHPVTGIESPRANDYCIAGTDRDDRWIHDVLDSEGNRLGGEEMRDLLLMMERVPNCIYEHHWMIGDVAIFDNQAFVHGREGLDLLPGEERLLWRCNVDHDLGFRLP